MKGNCSSVVFVIMWGNWLTTTTRWCCLNFSAVFRLPLEGCFWKYISDIPTRNIKCWCVRSLWALHLKTAVFSRLRWEGISKRKSYLTFHTLSLGMLQVLLRTTSNWRPFTWRAKLLFRYVPSCVGGIFLKTHVWQSKQIRCQRG